MKRKTTKNKTTKKRTKTVWKKAGEEFIDSKSAQSFANKINNTKKGTYSNKKARLKKNGRGRTRATINGKGYLGKYNKNGTFTVNTFVVETTNTKKS
jgi:hypothetical protein